jgi:hypothetical protein
MKVLKLKEHYKDSYRSIEKGRLFITYNNEAILIASPTQPTVFIGNYFLNALQKNNSLEEVDLENEYMYHPHLYKPIKELLKGK